MIDVQPDRVTVAACIGCGARERFADCTGDCRDRRLEFVHAEEHRRLCATVEEVRRSQAALRAVVARLLAGEPEPGAYQELQGEARRALAGRRAAGADDRAQRVAMWWCASCGRIEAPQPCIGVCVREREELVSAERHQEACEQLAAARVQEERLAGLARLLASVTPRAGHEQRGWQAMRTRALDVLDCP